MKEKKAINKTLFKLLIQTKIKNLIHKENFIFNQGQTKNILEISKKPIKYTIIKFKVSHQNDKYLVFIIIQIKKQVLTHQMLKCFSHNDDADLYISDLEKYLKSNNNVTILNACYKNTNLQVQPRFSYRKNTL